jgi:hypothetical protein
VIFVQWVRIALTQMSSDTYFEVLRDNRCHGPIPIETAFFTTNHCTAFDRADCRSWHTCQTMPPAHHLTACHEILKAPATHSNRVKILKYEGSLSEPSIAVHYDIKTQESQNAIKASNIVNNETTVRSDPSTSAAAAVVGAPFGTVLGNYGRVEVRSCLLPPGKKAVDMEPAYYNDIYTGVQWQCVELARRFLLIEHGVSFDSMNMAFEIFDSGVFRQIKDGQVVHMKRHANGSMCRPITGSLLIWNAVGKYAPTGHVAVVIDVQDTHVDIIEQNFYHDVWPQGQHYSRRLPVKCSCQGYSIDKFYDEEELFGWMTLS